MNRALFLAQRITAAILSLAVCVHLVTILYAAQSGITAGQILHRTQGNVPFLFLYCTFVVAAAIHAPIGLRNIAREWLQARGWRTDAILCAFGAVMVGLGLRAAIGLFLA